MRKKSKQELSRLAGSGGSVLRIGISQVPRYCAVTIAQASAGSGGCVKMPTQGYRVFSLLPAVRRVEYLRLSIVPMLCDPAGVMARPNSECMLLTPEGHRT